MEKMLINLVDALVDLEAGTETLQRQVFKGNGLIAKLIVDKGSVTLSVKSANQKNMENSVDPDTEKLEIKQRQCIQIRDEFHRYTKAFDNSMFNTICKQFKPYQLRAMNRNIEDNNTDPELMLSTIETFKNMADKVIMGTITQLKSQMTSFPKQQ